MKSFEVEDPKLISMFIMFYVLFGSVNNKQFQSCYTIHQFKNLINRLAVLYALDEHEDTRDASCDDEKVSISFKEAEITWGYKVASEEKETADKGEG